jgi:hypothetical protein
MHHHEREYLQKCAKGLMLVGVSNLLVRKIGLSLHEGDEHELNDSEIEQLLWLDREQIGSVLEEVQAYVSEVKSLF